MADGDALILPMDHWEAILDRAADTFVSLRQVSCYATATNILEKTDAELQRLVELGLTLLYIGPESGDEATMRRIAKGPRPRGRAETMPTSSTPTWLRPRRPRRPDSASAPSSCWGWRIARSDEHARGSAEPHHPDGPRLPLGAHADRGPGTPGAHPGQHRLDAAGGASAARLRTMVAESRPTKALFPWTNHASNYLAPRRDSAGRSRTHRRHPGSRAQRCHSPPPRVEPRAVMEWGVWVSNVDLCRGRYVARTELGRRGAQHGSGRTTQGVMTGIGHGLGVGGYAVVAVLGLAVFFEAFPTATRAVELAGAGYLVWLGIAALRHAGQGDMGLAEGGSAAASWTAWPSHS